MKEKIDSTSFLKKNDHLNDSIDRSLVNEYTSKTGYEIFIEFHKNSLIIGIPFLYFFFIEITNVIFLSDNSEDLLFEKNKINYLKNYILIQSFYYLFGFLFFFGAMKYYESFINYDKREMKLKSIFYGFSRIFYLSSSIFYIFPLSFFSFFFLKNIVDDLEVLEEFYSKYLIFTPLIFYMTNLFHLNLQILKKYHSIYYLFILNFICYWGFLYVLSFLLRNRILQLSCALISTNFITLILSHIEIKKKVIYLEDISFFYLDEIFQIKIESFLTFIKYSSFKGFLFIFNYLGVFIVMIASYFISPLLIISSFFSFALIGFAHSYNLSVSKYYKNYLEQSVYDHSQNTKTRYLKYFWMIIISVSMFFSIIIFFLKEKFFFFLLKISENEHESEYCFIFDYYNLIIKFYSIFIFIDLLGISCQEIIKTFNDHSRKYLSFYRGISQVLIFFPIGILISNFSDIDIFLGFWMGFYIHVFIYSTILIIIANKNYFTSTFQFST